MSCRNCIDIAAAQFRCRQGLPITQWSTSGRVRLHRDVPQAETQTRQERDAIACRVREAAENL